MGPLSHLRLVPRATLAAYQAKRRQVLRLRSQMSPHFIAGTQGGADALGASVSPLDSHILFQPFAPGYLGLSAQDAELVRAAQKEPLELPAALHAKIAERGWLKAPDANLDELLRKSADDFPAIQNPTELRLFLERVAALRPRVVVEIGTAAGGVFQALAALADPQALLCSIDLPGGAYGGASDAAIDRVANELLLALGGPQQEVFLIRDRSSHFSTLAELRKRLGERRIDLLFIDGDHSYGGVLSDFRMYAPLVRPGGLIALHDICVTPMNSGRGFDVGIFWQELRARHRTEELIDPKGVAGLRPQPRSDAAPRPLALGIGLLYVD